MIDQSDAIPVREPEEPPIPVGLLPDWAIERYVKIEPLAEGIPRPGKISYGLSSYGYDCRIGYKFKVFTPVFSVEVDPKAPSPKAFQDIDLTPFFFHVINSDARDNYSCERCDKELEGKNTIDGLCPKAGPHFVTIPPNSYALGESVETFKIPADVQCVCVGKSTYARAGVIVNVTPLEPAWRGKVTIEISNSTPLPVRVYAGEGIMQILFFRSAPCRQTYADKKAGKAGKYQDQQGLTLPTVD